MDGSGIDFVVIPVVVLPILAFWLYGMYFAAAHPRWLSGPSGQREIAAPAIAVVVPPQVPGVILPSVAEPEDSVAAAGGSAAAETL